MLIVARQREIYREQIIEIIDIFGIPVNSYLLNSSGAIQILRIRKIGFQFSAAKIVEY